MSDLEYPTELARQRHEMEMLWSEVEALRDEVRTLRHTLSKEKSRFREELCEPYQRALHTIAGVVCEHYRISLPTIVGPRRHVEIARPRQIICWIAWKETMLSQTQIGNALGKRHHTTVRHAVAQVEALRSTDNAYLQQTDELLSKCLAALKAGDSA